MPEWMQDILKDLMILHLYAFGRVAQAQYLLPQEEDRMAQAQSHVDANDPDPSWKAMLDRLTAEVARLRLELKTWTDRYTTSGNLLQQFDVVVPFRV